MSVTYQLYSPDGLTVIKEVTVETAEDWLRQRLKSHRPRKIVISKVIESKQIKGESK